MDNHLRGAVEEGVWKEEGEEEEKGEEDRRGILPNGSKGSN